MVRGESRLKRGSKSKHGELLQFNGRRLLWAHWRGKCASVDALRFRVARTKEGGRGVDACRRSTLSQIVLQIGANKPREPNRAVWNTLKSKHISGSSGRRRPLRLLSAFVLWG